MAGDSRGYYDLLGLSFGASINNVKKAYKQKQVELHPSGAKRRDLRTSQAFSMLSDEAKAKKEKELDDEISKINEAFSVLSAPEKKKEYDEGKGQFAEHEMGSGFGGFGDIFSHFTGGGRRQQQQAKYKAKDTLVEVKLSMKEAFVGKVSKYKIKIKKICKTCSGNGAKEVNTCGKCKGTGTIYIQKSLGIMFTQQQAICPDCSGAGMKPVGPLCAECKGEKVTVNPEIMDIKIRAGVVDGEVIKYAGKGNQIPRCEPGDLIFQVSVIPNIDYTRNEDDLVAKVDIDLLTALCGGACYFEHLDGRKLAVKVAPIKNFENAICIPDEGFQGNYKRGDLYLKPNLIMSQPLDRAKLSEYIKPAVHKPFGEHLNTNSVSKKVPEYVRRDSEDEHGGHEDIFSSFRFF